MTFDLKKFQREKLSNIKNIRENKKITEIALNFITESDIHQYGYFWEWEGLPLIQMPEDIVLTQEIIISEQPHYIIEAGIAWGGQTAMCASLLSLIGGKKIYGIDIFIPNHNRKRIFATRNSSLIELIEGDSTNFDTYQGISQKIESDARKLVILDSNHTHEHVLAELRLWSSLLSKGDYLIISDTIVNFIPKQDHRPRPWGPTNNPGTALEFFLKENSRFSRHNKYNDRALLSYNVGGYIECIANLDD